MRRILAVSAVLSVLVAGCGQGGLYDVPLPGGPDVGAHSYRVVVSFANVLDLVPQSSVKVADVAVGKVESVELAPDGRTAQVSLVLNGDVDLPGNAIARLRQSSLLGEKFVELAPSDVEGALGRLADGARITADRTNRSPEVEEVFGALSLLLNGGGIGQIQNINQELNAALGGNETAARELLHNLDTFIGGLDQHRGEVTRALDGVNRLAATLDREKPLIDTALTDLTPGIEAISQQREALVGMLRSLAELSDVSVDTVNRSKDDLVADLHALEPTLRRLADSGAALPAAMQTLLTFPFPDESLNAVRGDYLNSYLNFDARTGGGGGG
ncbi:MCE family protein [Saccharopolyspora taberi]|uniref:MCE family protein n=1 Tax=Saccharopolyspora taberi TaxID=60895 RepID=A0ABN3VE42_9PSEU